MGVVVIHHSRFCHILCALFVCNVCNVLMQMRAAREKSLEWLCVIDRQLGEEKKRKEKKRSLASLSYHIVYVGYRMYIKELYIVYKWFGGSLVQKQYPVLLYKR